ncbi:MAG: hypothetical protein JST48_06250 [Bacteroidetes bacterium]|nr:hypothetical protein [Bacteroidota bacterium]
MQPAVSTSAKHHEAKIKISCECWLCQVGRPDRHIKQIDFYQACGLFENKAEAEKLYDQLAKLLLLIQEEATIGKKSEGGRLGMYNNEILIADNTVFARMGSKRSVYVNQNALNLLLTFQEPFCEQTELYLQNLIKKSTQISVTGERARNRFFKNMNAKIESFKPTLGVV